MNDIAKKAISDKLRKALSEEKIGQQKASELLGLKSKHYPGFICSSSEKQWKNVSAAAWQQVRDWTNSGETLVNYHKKFVQTGELFNGGPVDTQKPVQPKFPADRIEKGEKKHRKRETSWLSKKKEMDQNIALRNSPKTEDSKSSHDSFELITDQGLKIKIDFEINMVIKLNGQEIRL